MIRRLLVLAAALVLSSCASPLTGLYCAEGFTQCENQCVDLQNDLDNCGGCGISCPSTGWQCIGGRCGRELPGGGIDFDASIPLDGAVVDGAVDGGPRDGGGTDATVPRPVPDPQKPFCDGTTAEDECRCDVGYLKCGNICVVPETDPEHCGGCDQACMDGQFCAGGSCVDNCDDPLVRCAGLCLDLQSDFRHCGQCGNTCPTHICRDGMCSGNSAGHVVVVGHDYTATNPEQSKIPPSAVLLNNKFEPAILGYSEHSEPTTVERINVTLADSLGILPEDIEEAVLPALSLQLASKDVLIIYPQTRLRQSDLMTKVRTAFEGVLPSFLEGGGVVLLFEGGGDRNRGTYQLLVADDLVPITGRTSVDVGPVLKTQAGFFGFTNGVDFPYRGERNTFGFEGVPITDPSVLLYHEETELPVVIHNIFMTLD